MEVCPSRAEYHRVLTESIGGGDLSRPALVKSMVRSEGEWDAVTSFLTRSWPGCVELHSRLKELSANLTWFINEPGRLFRSTQGSQDSFDDFLRQKKNIISNK